VKNKILKGNNMLQVISGLIAGIVSGIGMGGGTVLIFLLSMIGGMEQHIAQATNLVFFIPTSISAIIVNFKNKNINLKRVLIISIAGIFGAIIGAKYAVNTNVKTLKKYFGIFLLIIAIHEIYTLIKQYINYKNRNNKINI
jgi:hypothetical protein